MFYFFLYLKSVFSVLRYNINRNLVWLWRNLNVCKFSVSIKVFCTSFIYFVTMNYGALSSVDPGIHINWHINNIFKVMQTKNASLSSKEFQFAGNMWRMSIYFDNTKIIQLTLILLENLHEKTDIHCTLGIKKSDGSIYRNSEKIVEFNMNGDLYRFTILKNDLLASTNVLSRNDKILTVYCKLCLMDNNSVFNNISCGQSSVSVRAASSQTSALESIETLSENFKELLTNGQYADVVFKVQSKEFKAHKSVLAARSPVLESMFSHKMLESSSGVVTIDDCNEDTFQDFLVFLYSGRLDHISSGNAVGLYEIADKYDLVPLREECAKRLAIYMDVDSVCDALSVAVMHNEIELLKTATNFFMENADIILKRPEWKSFCMDHFDFGNDLFIKCLLKHKK